MAPPAPELTYLDHAATTPMRPEARDAMLPWIGDRFGNPSGTHRLARQARRALDDARDAVAELAGCRPGEVVFTSGGTEADNTAVLGAGEAPSGTRVPVCSAIEHHAVLDPVQAAGGRTVRVDGRGILDLDHLAATLQSVVADGGSVPVVSVMLANNEVGTIQSLHEIAEVVATHAPGAALHTDAVQAACWLDLTTAAAPAQLLSLSAHKFGGPQGAGALIVRDGAALAPLLTGGGQERDRRSGTQGVAGAVGMGAAAAALAGDRKAMVDRVERLRDRLLDGLRQAVPTTVVTGAAPNGDLAHKVAGSAHVCFPGVESEELLFLLDQEGVCATAGSSCASGALDGSQVLAALGVSPEQAAGALRLSLGWTTTAADVDRALTAIPAAVHRLQGSIR